MRCPWHVQIELWRSDLLTSVIEIDETGLLLNGGLTNPLCPPGMGTPCLGPVLYYR